MATWDPAQYLRFERERTQPCRDLVARIELSDPRRIADLGCGPGNSTAVLRSRWPRAEVVGIDRSPEMLATARPSDPSVRWVEADAATWSPEAPVDLLFSNAALQWLPDHEHQFPRLLRLVAPGGAFAAQMPANVDEPYQRAAARLSESPTWAPYLGRLTADFDLDGPQRYFDRLAPHAARIELWDTRYVHVLEGPEAVVEWTTGTGLRPWLAALPDDAHRERFLAEYRAEIRREYPARSGGRVLFPFLRRFVVAYRERVGRAAPRSIARPQG
jgi:trans-aconitate 2-methyltransferase